MDFTKSSQHQNFIFESKEALACESSIKHDMSLSDLEEWDLCCRADANPDAVRARANQQAVEAMTQGKPELVLPSCFAVAPDEEVASASSMATDSNSRPTTPEPVNPAELLTAAEETAFKRYFEAKVQETCGPRSKLIPRQRQVQATALAFFKRFYLSNSLMEYAPKTVMATCIYLAGKTECQYITIQEIKSSLSDKLGDEVVDFEIKLLQGLGFYLKVHHPYNPYYGLLDGLEKMEKTYKKGLTDKHLKELRSKGNGIMDLLMISDVVLLFTPARIALAVLLEAAKEAEILPMVEGFMKECFGPEEEYEAQVVQDIKKINVYIRQEKEEAKVVRQYEAEDAYDAYAAEKYSPFDVKLRKCARWSGKGKKRKRDSSSTKCGGGAAAVASK